MRLSITPSSGSGTAFRLVLLTAGKRLQDRMTVDIENYAGDGLVTVSVCNHAWTFRNRPLKHPLNKNLVTVSLLSPG